MLRGHRSTFKPTSGSCLDRTNSPLGITQSIGLGENTDAGFTLGDNFTDFEIAEINVIDVPSDASIVRVYTTAAGKQAACITYSDPCREGGSFSCDADSECCPEPCETGICCTPETRECINGVCKSDCKTCWQSFPPDASQEDIDAACEYCGKCACCDESSGSPFCKCNDIGDPDDDGDGALCFSAPAGNCRAVDSCTECETEPPTEVWRCEGPDGCDGGYSSCECRKFESGSGSSSKEQCESANPACKGGAEPGERIFQCCSGGCQPVVIPTDGPPASCAGGGSFYCTEALCIECCAKGVTEFNRTSSVYASSVVPAFSTAKKAGDDLSATEKSILDRGKPTLTTATAISASTATAFKARLLHANLLDVSAAIQPSTSKEIVVDFTGSCDVCTDRKLDNDENVNCGSVIPSMFIAEYNIGGLCASLTNVQLTVLKVIQTIEGTEQKEELVIIILQGTPVDSSGNSLGNIETLLVDVAESGYLVPNTGQGTIDCEECGITYDCEGTLLVNGRYPTITSNIESNDREKYGIPTAQPAFPVLDGKLQHIRPSSHTIGERSFSITTTVLGIGSEKEVYTSPADADRIPTITGGPANHSDGGNSNITTKLVFDLDAIAAETQGNTYISVLDTNTLQHHYGVPGMGDCAIAGEYATSGEALFAAVFSDTPQEVDTDDDGGGSDCEDPFSDSCEYVFSAFENDSVPAANGNWVLDATDRDGNGNAHALNTEIGLDRIIFKENILGPNNPPYMVFTSGGLAAKFLASNRGIKFSPISTSPSANSPMTIGPSDLSAGSGFNVVLINYTENTGNLAEDIAEPFTPAIPNGRLVPVRVESV